MADKTTDKIKDKIKDVIYTKEYIADNNMLTETNTPSEIVANVKIYNIEAIQKEIVKINTMIKMWQDKLAPLEAIIALYNENKPVPEIVNGVEEIK